MRSELGIQLEDKKFKDGLQSLSRQHLVSVWFSHWLKLHLLYSIILFLNCLSVHTHILAHTLTCTLVCTYTHIHVHVITHTLSYVHTCTLNTHIHTCTCIYVHCSMYTHIHTQNLLSRSWGVTTLIPSKWWTTRKLQKHIHYIYTCDYLLIKNGIDELNPNTVKEVHGNITCTCTCVYILESFHAKYYMYMYILK